MNKKMWKNVIEVPSSGQKTWPGGAYVHAFVYSNKGNFLVKGFYQEVIAYLKTLRPEGYKYFVNFVLFGTHRFLTKDGEKLPFDIKKSFQLTTDMIADGFEIKTEKTCRSIWRFWDEDVFILEPEQIRCIDYNEPGLRFKRSNKWKNWRVKRWGNSLERIPDKILEFKRLPKRWIPEFENM